MIKIKTAQFDQRPDFADSGIRRLMGALSDQQTRASQALERLEGYLSDGRMDVSLQEIRADNELRYWLQSIFGNEWEKLVTGNVI